MVFKLFKKEGDYEAALGHLGKGYTVFRINMRIGIGRQGFWDGRDIPLGMMIGMTRGIGKQQRLQEKQL